MRFGPSAEYSGEKIRVSVRPGPGAREREVYRA